MIVSGSPEMRWQYDTGRPSFFNDQDLQRWRTIFEWIESCPHNIGVNGAYSAVRDLCFRGQCYGGGGFRFVFWFDNREARREFHALLEQQLGGSSSIDPRNVWLHRHQNGEITLRVSVPKYEKALADWLQDRPECSLNEHEVHGNEVIGPIGSLLELQSHLKEYFLENLQE